MEYRGEFAHEMLGRNATLATARGWHYTAWHTLLKVWRAVTMTAASQDLKVLR
jgi:hypothetical protein